MRIITQTRIKTAMTTYPQWKIGLQLWLETFKSKDVCAESYQQIKDVWKKASGWNVDRIPARKVDEGRFQGEGFDCYIFDIHSTACRIIITRIQMSTNKIFVRDVLTHADYDKWCKARVKS